MVNHVSFITHADMDGAVSHAVAKKVFMIKFPTAKMDMKCCGYGRIREMLNKLAELGNDVLVITDLMIEPEDLKFAVKHWREIYLFDHHLDTARYEELSVLLGDRMTFRYDVEMSATAIVYKWALQEIGGLPALMTPEWKRLIQLTNTYDLWKTDRPEWQDAYNLNELFWHKNFWKFSDRFCASGFNKFTAYERKVIKECWDRKVKIITESPKEKWDGNAAFIFLSDSEAINACEFLMSDIDYYYIVYPRRGTVDLGLSVRVREHPLASQRNMNVSEVLSLAVKEFPQVFENGSGHELAGGGTMFPGTKIEDVYKACEWMNHKINPDVDLPF